MCFFAEAGLAVQFVIPLLAAQPAASGPRRTCCWQSVAFPIVGHFVSEFIFDLTFWTSAASEEPLEGLRYFCRRLLLDKQGGLRPVDVLC